MDLLSVGLEFLLAVLLAFAGFWLRAVVKRQDAMSEGFQSLAREVAAFRGEARAGLADLADRISRLERVQDEDNRDRKQT